MTISTKVRDYIRDNFLFGGDFPFSDSTSLLEVGVIDSTGAMELVGFLESEFAITVEDRDLVPQNLDSVFAIAAFVTQRLRESPKQTSVPLDATS